jgi:hypothetical protein
MGLAKYHFRSDALFVSDAELTHDFQLVQARIEREFGGSRCNRLGVLEGWISAEISRRRGVFG